MFIYNAVSTIFVYGFYTVYMYILYIKSDHLKKKTKKLGFIIKVYHIM